ncbi:glycosyltransferase family 2 protein [Tenacibaculum jejuense]|uniref:Glycosyl transferase, group 2 family protein n=1 Tax=Tenacibaculum jejuense TaxID=584609 RepID=A0A238UEU7_9FLAO|nr:glycosyltransferase family 2 protein [Tenacibaculum jejuense]SNR17699.1 Glycosyl transferase, group 2 family protein [Tenacibaculum jejuense]
MNHFFPLISIITVTYNSEETIKDTIESVLNQSYENIEYIIVDGASKDTTLNIIRLYEEKFAEKKFAYSWISESDSGIYDAMNKGIDIAKGKLIGIINSDDWYELDAIEKVVNLFQKNSKAIISGAMNRVTHEKKVYKTMLNKNISNVSNFMPINHPASFVPKDIYTSIGKFDTYYKLSADYDFMFRAFKANIPFLYTEDLLVNMRNSGATSQVKNLWISSSEDYHIQKKNHVKNAFLNYIKKQAFNCLVAFRDIVIKPIKNG